MLLNLDPIYLNLFWTATYPKHYEFLKIIEKKEVWTNKINLLESLTLQFCLLKEDNISNNNYILQIIEILNYLPLSTTLYILMWMEKNYPVLTFEYIMIARKNTVGEAFLARLKLLNDSNSFTQIYKSLSSPILQKLIQIQ